MMSSRLFDELRIAADLERFHPMRFQSVRLPNSSHAGGADTQRSSHAPRAPVRRAAGLLLRGLANDFLGINLAHSARSRSILLDSRYAAFQKTYPPVRHRVPPNRKAGRNLTILLPFGGLQNNTRSFHTRCATERPRAYPESFALCSSLNRIGEATRIRPPSTLDRSFPG